MAETTSRTRARKPAKAADEPAAVEATAPEVPAVEDDELTLAAPEVGAAPLEPPHAPVDEPVAQPTQIPALRVNAVPNSTFVAFVDENGQPFTDPDEVFGEAAPGATVMLVKQRIHQLEMPDNATTPITRLIATPGTTVPRPVAGRLSEVIRSQAGEPAE